MKVAVDAVAIIIILYVAWDIHVHVGLHVHVRYNVCIKYAIDFVTVFYRSYPDT
jgi:hypothetical protein